jgi:hypothetical protein
MRMLVKTRQWCSTINTYDRANIELFWSSPSTLVLSLFNGNQGRRSREGRRRTTGRRSVLLIGGGKSGETESNRDGNLVLLRRSVIGEWRLSPIDVERIFPRTRTRQDRRPLSTPAETFRHLPNSNLHGKSFVLDGVDPFSPGRDLVGLFVDVRPMTS